MGAVQVKHFVESFTSFCGKFKVEEHELVLVVVTKNGLVHPSFGYEIPLTDDDLCPECCVVAAQAVVNGVGPREAARHLKLASP
jgi:hypothetical protein